MSAGERILKNLIFGALLQLDGVTESTEDACEIWIPSNSIPQEVMAWCHDHNIPFSYRSSLNLENWKEGKASRFLYGFDDDDHATLFKLQWGGE